jgi:GntR family transcriptional repressor for pyruvate dehydrogenase complex
MRADGNRGASRPVSLAILEHLARARGPVGQGTLGFLLRRQGINVSTPTVGRELQTLEFKRLVRKVGVEGRVITPQGTERLREWAADARLRLVADAFIRTLKRADRRALIDLLAARRIIERETAALAATNASGPTIRQLEALLHVQAQSIQRGDLGVREDVEFHQMIARASGNPVLASVVAVLRQHHRYNVVVTAIRAAMGGRLIEDHRSILRGIKSKRPEAARRAMDAHLRALMADLRRYLFGGRGRATPAAAAGRSRSAQRPEPAGPSSRRTVMRDHAGRAR